MLQTAYAPIWVDARSYLFCDGTQILVLLTLSSREPTLQCTSPTQTIMSTQNPSNPINRLCGNHQTLDHGHQDTAQNETWDPNHQEKWLGPSPWTDSRNWQGLLQTALTSDVNWPPLVTDLGILTCHEPPFDGITQCQYIFPDGMDPGSRLLHQHLVQPPKVPDCPTMPLAKEIPHNGWQKAKEQTSSSLSGAHFGHYKVGTNSDLINAVHMVIPLKTGFSYNALLVERDQCDVRKPPGNFQVGKLRITLLLKAYFNKLNKHIGLEMIYHAEQYSLVAREQYESWHDHSSITQSLNKRLTFAWTSTN